MEVSSFLNLGSLLINCAGMPTSDKPGSSLCAFKIARFNLFLEISYVVLPLLLYFSVPDDFFTAGRFETYHGVVFYATSVGNLTVVGYMNWKRQQILDIFDLARKLDSAGKVYSNVKKARNFTLLRLFSLVTILAGLGLDLFNCFETTSATNFYKYFTKRIEKMVLMQKFAIAISVVCLIPFFIVYWATQYNIMLFCINEIEIIDNIHQQICEGCDFPNRNRLTFVIPDNESISNSTSMSVLIRNYSALGFSRRLVLISETNSFRVKFQSLYYPLIGWNMMNACFFFPLLLLTVGLSFSKEYSSVFTAGTGTMLVIFNFLSAIQVYILNEWLKYKRKCLSVAATNKMFSTNDPISHSYFLNLSERLSDDYLDSPCVLFDIDCALVNLMIDTIMLLGTTFLLIQEHN